MMQSNTVSHGNREPERHSHLYFPDGDIVLSAHDSTQTIILMRVHRVMLRHNSTVFADMLSLPEVPGSNNTYDGTSVVHMSDPAEDLVAVLGNLYNVEDPFPLSPTADEPNWPFRIRSVLALATKYQMDSIRARIVDGITAQWPQTLQEWIELQGKVAARNEYWEVQRHRPQAVAQVRPRPHLQYTIPEPVSAINLATEFDIPAILPAAFYRLAITDLQFDFGSAYPRATDYAAAWSYLDQRNWLRLSKGKDVLVLYHGNLADAYDEPTYHLERCLRGGECREVAQTLRRKHDEAFNMDFARQPDILGLIFRILNSGQTDEWDLCAPCAFAIKNNMNDLMEGIWNDLPKTFKLE